MSTNSFALLGLVFALAQPDSASEPDPRSTARAGIELGDDQKPAEIRHHRPVHDRTSASSTGATASSPPTSEMDLFYWRKRKRWLIPGSIAVGIGTAVLATSAVAQVSVGIPRNPGTVLLNWVVPAGLAVAGLPMVLVGTQAAIRVRRHRLRVQLNPVLGPEGAGLTLRGQF